VSSLFIANTSASDNPTMNALLSTSAGLQSNIQFNADNLMNNYTNIDLFKILSNTVDKSVSYSSSITTTDFMGVYSGTAITPKTVTVSTIQFRLDSMSSFINNGAQVVLSYSPSLLYNFNTTIYQTEIANLSTFLMAGDSRIYGGTFVRPWLIQATNPGIPPPSLYTDTLKFVLDSSNINSALDSTFTFYHKLDVSGNIVGSSPINVLTCENNSFNVTLTGMNY
jgi:hypothetical protein